MALIKTDRKAYKGKSKPKPTVNCKTPV